MLTASWRDVEVAGFQGTITGITLSVSGSSYGKNLVQKASDNSALTTSWLVLLFSAVLFGFAGYRFKNILEESELAEPLVPSSDGIAA
jgi:ABC-type multidrug transport system permease subunit